MSRSSDLIAHALRTLFSPVVAGWKSISRVLALIRHLSHFLWIPLAVGISLHLVVPALPIVAKEGLIGFREHARSWESLSIAIIAALAVWIVELHISFGGDIEALQSFRKIVGDFETPMRQYGLRRLSDRIREVSLQIIHLQSDGLRGRTLREKIEIIQTILEDVTPYVTTYLATTLDRPSQLWPLNRFWELQVDLLAAATSKRRMVILDRKVLSDEIHNHHEVLREFVTWHMKERFELLFLIDEQNTFTKEADQFLEKLEQQRLVTDFAIINDRYVYGEIEQKTTDQPSTEAPVRDLLLFGPEPSGHHIVSDYIQLHSQLWQKWRGYKWRVMSAQQVLSECSRQKAKSELNSNTSTYYAGLGIRCSPGDCYEDVRERVAAAKQRLIAVDIAPLKSNLLDWTLKADYIRWQEATCQAAANARCSRIYVLNERMETLADRQVALQKILAPQKAAGVQIWLTSSEVLRQRGIPVHDFILVDNSLCLSLGWDEAFTAQTVSIAKNLEHQSTFAWYEHVFDNIVTSRLGHDVSALADEQVLDYLHTLEIA